MKKRFYLILIWLSVVISCAEKQMDLEKAKIVAEEHITAADAGNYDRIEKLYAASFLSGESMSAKQEKLEKLKEIKGTLQSKELDKYTHVAEFGQPKQLVLEYKVNYSKLNTIEKFTLIEDEGGYKIAAYGVESVN